MTFIGIIPARYASTRFPGKPLADMKGKPMIQRVYEQVEGVLDAVCVATDDQKVGAGFEVVINIQGDEPFIHPEQIETLKRCFDDPATEIATLVKPFDPNGDFEGTLFNPNSPKVVFNKRMEALYFSRSIIPYIRGEHYTEWLRTRTFYKHIGLYAYRAATLREITALPQSELEKAESLEQLRWLENGYRIKVGITHQETIGIDTPEDMARAIEFMEKRG